MLDNETRQYILDDPDRILKKLFENCKGTATIKKNVVSKAYGQIFDLTLDWVKETIINQENKCPITGIEFYYGPHNKLHGKGGSPGRPSLDRINSEVGYTQSNVRIICNLANRLHGTWSDDEVKPFLEGIANIYRKD